jgi:hypothetical protein
MCRSIYNQPNSQEFYTENEIERLVSEHMVGKSFHGLPIRTRSKVSKALICESLGYDVPKSFKKTKPRFPTQNLDTYVQKSDNLQIWNDEIDPTRRYLLIRVDDNDVVIGAKVVTGFELSFLDTTGTLTKKHQAKLEINEDICELISKTDTDKLNELIVDKEKDFKGISPIDNPTTETLLPIEFIYDKLKSLIGTKLEYVGSDQERNRGAELHKLVCQTLGYQEYKDDGQFPDIKNQLLEIKLQTSTTINLGIVCPDSNHKPIMGMDLTHKDVRYVLFYGVVNGDEVTLTNLYLTNGEDFFNRFPQFQGNVVNHKIQIPLPKDFFNVQESI